MLRADSYLKGFRREPAMKQRVQKILAQAGVASRRKSEQLIEQGRVCVNGKLVKLGESADPDKDKITVNGKRIMLEKKVTLMLNKPKGYVTTVTEQHGMKTVMDLVKVPQKVFPIGRLDKYTEGLLLLTNDGDLANKLTHPRYEVEKEYYVVLNKPPNKKAIEKLQKGMLVDNRRVKLSYLDVQGKHVVLRIHEGRTHIVRRIFEMLELRVVRLVRTKVAALELSNVPVGKWKILTSKELNRLVSG